MPETEAGVPLAEVDAWRAVAWLVAKVEESERARTEAEERQAAAEACNRQQFIRAEAAEGRAERAEAALAEERAKREAAEGAYETLRKMWEVSALVKRAEAAEARVRELETEQSILLEGDWLDKPIPEDNAIDSAFPTISKRHDLYAHAMRMVGARRSKGSLVALVNWLLVRADGTPTALDLAAIETRAAAANDYEDDDPDQVTEFLAHALVDVHALVTEVRRLSGRVNRWFE